VNFLLSAQSEDDPVGVIVSEKRLIVECDGSDFHDTLLSSSLCAIDGGRCASNPGFDVFGYSGAEICRDCFAVSGERSNS
jgi:hypothetical protein